MVSAHRSPALPNWRTVLIVVACAAAGGGLRWSLREHDSIGADNTVTAVPAAVLTKPPPALTTRLTAESLGTLPNLDKLTAIAAALPHMTVGEIVPLVEVLAASRVENWRYDPDKTSDALLVALFTRWAELDAPGMIAALEGPAFRYATGTRQFAVSAWAELRGIPALEAVRKQWPGLAEQAAWEMVARHPEQMEGIFPWLARGHRGYLYDKEFKRLVGLERCFRLAAALDPMGYALGTLGEIEDESYARQIVKALPPCRIKDDALLRMPLGADSREWRAEYETLPPGRVRDELAGGYAGFLEEENPGAGLAWARSLPNGKARGKALQGIADRLLHGISSDLLGGNHNSGAAPADPFAAGADPFAFGDDQTGNFEKPGAGTTNLYAEAWLADPVGQAGVARENFEKWRAVEPGAAEAWLQTVTNPALRAELVPLFPDAGDQSYDSENYPVGDWVYAVQLAEAATSEGKVAEWEAAGSEERRNVSASAMNYFAERLAPEKAMEFFDSLAPEERSLGAWYEAGRVKMSVDLEAASQWMASLPQGPERDAAATALVEYLASTGPEQSGIFVGKNRGVTLPAPYEDRDPETAFRWAADMSGETERVRHITLAARAWAMEDAAAARAAVSSANLPEADKQFLLRQLPEGGAQ